MFELLEVLIFSSYMLQTYKNICITPGYNSIINIVQFSSCTMYPAVSTVVDRTVYILIQQDY